MKTLKHLWMAILWFVAFPSQLHAAEEGKGINVSEIVFGHIEDAYEWHITDIGGKSLRIPLLVIVRSSTGWHVFSSSRLENGQEYEGLYIAGDGEHAKKIVERDASGKEVRPIDISITKNVLALFINSIVLVGIMLACARWYKRHDVSDGVPSGGVGIMEAIIMMIHDDVIKDCIGEDYKRYAPYLLTAFFFILINNLMGLIPFFPGGANVTGNIAITFILALCTFLFTNLGATKGYWKDILWPEVPTWLKAPVPLMPAIELFGVFTKPFSLMIRLFANIMAGHAAILSLVSIIFITVKVGPAINGTMTFIAVFFGIFMDLLEVLVAFIQAYVFTMLSAVFIGMSRVREEKRGPERLISQTTK